jgi:hypothetical protein
VRKSKLHHTSPKKSPPPLPTRRGGRLCWALLVAGIAALLLLPLGFAPPALLLAQDDEEMTASRENRIKAAYLYQFGRYVDWPAKAFASPKSPFVIGVLEKDPLIPDLDQIARLKKIQDRAIKLRRFSAPAAIRACHILYLPASLSAEAHADVIGRTKGQGVLLVGDSPDFLSLGGIMQFVVEDNRIRVVISRKAAERAGLTISAKLLQVARVVD